MMCMSQSTNRSPSFMASSSASRSVLRSRLRSALVRRIHALEPAQQPRPHARALALARDRLLEDVLGHRDQLAARLRAHLDRARRLEVVHGHPRVGHRLADRQQPVVPQDERGLVAEVGHESRLLDFKGPALNDDEKPRIVADLGDKTSLILRNHGLLTVGETVADAWVAMYYLEASCAIQVRAQAGGELIPVPKDVLEQAVSRQRQGARVWPGLLRRLERVDPSYKS